MVEWLKKHWKVVAAVAAGAVGLYLLWQRSQGVAAPAAASGTDTGLPSTGTAPSSQPGSSAQPQFLNPGEQAAAGLAYQQAQQIAQPSGQDLVTQIRQEEQRTSAFLATNPISGAQPTGLVQQNWKQVIDAGQTLWEDVSGQNRAPLSEQGAQLFAQDQQYGEGPYYHSAGGTGILGFVSKYLVKPVEQFLTRGALGGGGNEAPISANDQVYQQAPVTTSAPSISPVPLGPPAPRTTIQHVPGPTTPPAISNHAVGAH